MSYHSTLTVHVLVHTMVFSAMVIRQGVTMSEQLQMITDPHSSYLLICTEPLSWIFFLSLNLGIKPINTTLSKPEEKVAD